MLGYRSMYFGSLRDRGCFFFLVRLPLTLFTAILISRIDDFLQRVRAYVRQQHDRVQETWQLQFHIYDGRNKDASLRTDIVPEEVFLIGEVLAETQVMATALADTARIATVVSDAECQVDFC